MLRLNQAPKRSGSAMLAHQPALLPLPILLLLMLALVVRLAAARNGELDLGPAAAVEIDGERDERHALAHHRAEHLADLALVEEQFARPFRLVIVAIAVAELGNVGVDQPYLPVLHLGIAFGDRSLAEAKRLHLGAGEGDAGLVDVLDGIIVARPAILGDHLLLVERGRARANHQLPVALFAGMTEGGRRLTASPHVRARR